MADKTYGYTIDDVRDVLGDDLTDRMVGVFQGERNFIEWFYTPIRELGNISPCDGYLDSQMDKVLDIMFRLEYGTLD